MVLYRLNNINLNLPSSGIVVLCGENGSGKTTLLNIIGMMDDNYDGDILFDEINYKSLNDSEKSLYREKCISYCFQKNNLISFLTAGQNRYLDKMLMIDKFDTVENQNVSNFSQGQQQSLAIFHLLKPGKRIYLLDEVTSCLDVNNTKRLIEDIRKLARESLIVIVSHNLELKDIADQVITLKKGEIIEEKIINFNDESQDDIKINDDRKFSWPLFLSYVKSVSIPAIFSLFINTLVYLFLFISIIGTTTAPRQALDPIYNDLTYVTTSISGGFNYDKLLEKYPNQ